MFLKTEKIYNVYEKPESAEPTERMMLVREGLNIFAFIFGPLWALIKRQWVILAVFIVALILLRTAALLLDISEIGEAVLQIGIYLIIAFHVSDLQAYSLRRKGYRFAGVLAAESPMHAQRRYYEFAA